VDIAAYPHARYTGPWYNECSVGGHLVAAVARIRYWRNKNMNRPIAFIAAAALFTGAASPASQ